MIKVNSQVPAEEIFREEFEKKDFDIQEFVDEAEKEFKINLQNKNGKRPLHGFVTTLERGGKIIAFVHRYVQPVANRKGSRPDKKLPDIEVKKHGGNIEKLRKFKRKGKSKKANMV